MKRTIVSLVAIAATLVGTSAAVADRGDGHEPPERALTYAVIGDTPYGQPQLDNFPNDVAQINADPAVRRVIHLGDIKNGSSVCSDAYFATVRTSFDAFSDPLVYTPGDNEWTDCHRTNNGAYSPLERLDAIRSTFFPVAGRTLGLNPRRVRAQAAPTVENVRWSQDDVMFATVHVVGSNNSWKTWTGRLTQTPEQVAEYTARNAADIAWLKDTFATARRERARGVVIGIQADMWDAFFSGANDAPAEYDHFTDFVQELARQSRAFRRPVLLLNGDSHVYTDDRPLADAAKPYQRTMYGVTDEVPNLRRVTVNGSTTPCHEYLRLSIDSESAAVFSVERVLFHNQPGFAPAVCPAS
jgi:hypothetical protein